MMNGGDHGVNGVNGGTNQWPNDVGIIDMEIYFPSQYVEQSEYETFKGMVILESKVLGYSPPRITSSK